MCRGKRDIKAGETLGAVGEYDYRAWIMTAEQARQENKVPCGLLQNAKVQSDIKKGDIVSYNQAQPDAGSAIVKLRNQQDMNLGYV